MALAFNGNRNLGNNRCRFNGAATNTYVDAAVKNNIYSAAAIDKRSGIPNGTKIPGSILMPMRDGGLSSYSLMKAEGRITAAQARAGLNLIASIAATGTITTAQVGLIINLASSLSASGIISSALLGAISSMLADLSASGAISTSDLLAVLNNMSASLVASGEVSAADMGAIIRMVGALSASGAFSQATPGSLANMEAIIGGPAPLSPEGLAEAVWNYLKSNPTTTDSMKDVLEKAKQSADNAFAVSS